MRGSNASASAQRFPARLSAPSLAPQKQEIKARGTFTFSSQAIGFSEMEEYLEGNK
jgi:hypothetical protein